MIKAEIEEDEEVTMARFMGGLNQEIANLVELYHYDHLEDMLQIAQNVKKQLKRRTRGTWVGASSNTPPNWHSNPTFSWKEGANKQGVEGPSIGGRKLEFSKEGTSKSLSSSSNSNPTSKKKYMQCFKCLVYRHVASKNMSYIKNYDHIRGWHSGQQKWQYKASDDEKMPVLMVEEVGYANEAKEGESLVTLRSWSTQVKEKEHKEQRANIFYTRCNAKDNVCTLKINSGSCTNLART